MEHSLSTTETKIILSEYQPNRHPALIYLATLRPSGRRSQLHALNVLAGLVQPGATAFNLAWEELRYQHTAALVVALEQQDYSPATINRSLCALRGVLREAWNLGLMPSEDYRRAVNFKGKRAETLPRGRALSGGELNRLMVVCWEDNTLAGYRDAALIAVLYGAGVRRSEIVKLTLADWDGVAGSLKVRSGKGNKDRLVYLEPGAAATLTDWLSVRGTVPGPLFLPIRRGGHLPDPADKPMSDQAVLDILVKRGGQAGLKHFSPHDLRRTFISDLLDAGADISTVQRLAGHADVGTTARYDRRGEEVKRRAAGMLHVPYQPRPRLSHT